jgi:stearoyl-CoA 9-desaturase NADPH oxidoreductase
MFTQTVTKRVLGSGLIDLLTGPHGVDRYTELATPTWSLSDARAKVVSVEGRTPRSVTLTLAPNDAFRGFKAGQHVNLTVKIDGRRHTRCYSPASAEGSPLIELTVGLHDGGSCSCPAAAASRP